MEQTSLITICNGAAHEVFQRELAAVLANIQDVNTEAQKKRRIVLTFDFAPSRARDNAGVSFNCRSVLAPVSPVESTVFIGKEGGEFKAYSHDIRQEDLFPEPEPGATTNILSMAPPAQKA